MPHVQNEGYSDMLPTVFAPAFENPTAQNLKLCTRKGGWSTKSPPLQGGVARPPRTGTPGLTCVSPGTRPGLSCPGRPGQPLGRRVHTTVISPVTAPSARWMATATGNSGRSPASSSATTSAAGRPRVAVAVTAPIASFL